MATRIIFTSIRGLKEIECLATNQNEIEISITDSDTTGAFIVLDKQTAIKLSKVLKSEISKLT